MQSGVHCMYCCAQSTQNTQIIFKMRFFCKSHISPNIYILCQQILANKLLQSSFCDQTVYITTVCRLISHITKITLLDNFLTES